MQYPQFYLSLTVQSLLFRNPDTPYNQVHHHTFLHNVSVIIFPARNHMARRSRGSRNSHPSHRPNRGTHSNIIYCLRRTLNANDPSIFYAFFPDAPQPQEVADHETINYLIESYEEENPDLYEEVECDSIGPDDYERDDMHGLAQTERPCSCHVQWSDLWEIHEWIFAVAPR
jgi:hypothetical protein